MSTLIPEFTLPKDFCADAREAYTIPARFYTHRAAFEHEKEQVFATSWICVAHRSELAQPNDYITREIIGENILVVRGRDNVLRALQRLPAPRPPAAGGRRPGEKRHHLPLSRTGVQAGRRTGARAQLRKRAELR